MLLSPILYTILLVQEVLKHFLMFGVFPQFSLKFIIKVLDKKNGCFTRENS